MPPYYQCITNHMKIAIKKYSNRINHHINTRCLQWMCKKCKSRRQLILKLKLKVASLEWNMYLKFFNLKSRLEFDTYQMRVLMRVHTGQHRDMVTKVNKY
jgi:hypothetical protein